MRRYRRSIEVRRRDADYKSKRYWSDPDYRLKAVNCARASKGLEPYASVDQIQTQGSYRA
jgi:hypothetical protein